MSHFTKLTAAAVLSLCAGMVTAMPAATASHVEYRQPLGQVPVQQIPVHAFAKSVPLRHITLDRTMLGTNATEAPPSDSVVAVARARRSAIGNDDRRELNSVDYPYSTMGRIIWSNGVYCSGSIVGPRHVAAARHCAPLDGQQVSLTFQRDYFNGERFPSSPITTAVYIPKGAQGDCDIKEDWVIFILRDRLGEQSGYLGATVVDDNELHRNMFTTFGYPGDLANGERTYIMNGITVDSANGCEAGGPIKTDADSAGGQSGSPIYRDNDGIYTYGALSVGVFVNGQQVQTWFSGGANFVNAVADMRSQFP